MNRKYLILILSVTVLSYLQVNAQNEIDVLRYSTISWGSTARSFGMGNSFGALGADASVMSTNPAGLGSYRHSEFTFTPSFKLRNNSSDLGAGSIDKNSFKMNMGNLALIWAFPNDNQNSDWKGWSIGLGYNRLNDFNTKAYGEAVNKTNSLVDSWVEQVNNDRSSQEDLSNLAVFPFDAALGWNALLFDPDTSVSNKYVTGIPGAGTRQKRTYESKGGMGEFDISFATNYMDKVYLGGSIGIVSVRYNQDLTWEETDENNTIRSPFAYDSIDFNSFRYSESIKTEGSGFNLKLGVVLRPADYIRVGLAVHTPTFLSLTDDYKTSVKSTFTDKNGQSFSNEYNSPDFIPFEYDIVTPFRAIASVGLVLGKAGLIGLEYEFVDYSGTDISPRDKTFDADFIVANKTIGSNYTAAHNFRAGGELRYKQLRFRLGASYYGTPFSSQANVTDDADQSRMGVNGGIGFREKNFFFDAGYGYLTSGSFSGMYKVNNVTTGSTDTYKDHRLMFTLGWNF